MPRRRARLGLLGAAAASGLPGLGVTGAAQAACASAPAATSAASATATGPRSAFDPSYDGGATVPSLTGEYLATGANAGTDGSVVGPDYAQELALTSAYSYIDTPQIYGSKTHHFFNDARIMFGFELHRGDTVRLQADAQDTALPYTVNLADFYQVAEPLSQPTHTVSVLSEGADPSGATDATAAFAAAASAANAAHEAVWIPAGDLTIGSPPAISAATLEGAGSWYTRIHSNAFIDNTAAVPGPVNLKNFAILGSTITHDVIADTNALGSGLTIDHANIQNVGAVVVQGETQGSAYVANVHASGVGVTGTVQDQYPPATPQFQFVLGPGNSGWSLSPTLAYFPNPSPAVP